MNKKSLFKCLILLIVTSACSQNSTSHKSFDLDKGVSCELASQRKKVISKINYDLQLNISNGTDSITANETITFDLSDNSAALPLDFKEDKSLLKSVEINGNKVAIDFQNEHLVLAKNYLKNGKNKIEIKLICGDKSLNRNEEVLYSLFVPEKARTFIPCFDQPDLKATFSLHATVPNDWEIVTNAPLMKEDTFNVNQKYVDFETSDMMSTYLFSVVAGKFKKETRDINGRTCNLYYRETSEEKIHESLDSIFELHKLSLDFMEDYTGIPYPFKKMDIVAIPDFTYGGMEHVGAINYQSNILFLDKTATQNEKLERINTIAHETAHMWFGDLVTMKWFDDVWMKEVFANFLADKVAKSASPKLDVRMHFLLSNHPGAYSIDRTEGANPIRQNLDNLDEAGSLYGEIIYQKAPIVMAQLEKSCGKENMKFGLSRYLKKYAFGNASWPDLIQILDEISDEDLADWNQQWINSSGIPEYDYKLQIGKNKIESLQINQVNPANRVLKQHFSIALIYEDHSVSLPIYMNKAEIKVKKAKGLKKPLFIVFNSEGSGYGVFPSNNKSLSKINLLSALMRASVYINAYENVLEGKNIRPTELINHYLNNFSTENEGQILSRMVRQFKNVYWQFLTTAERSKLNEKTEKQLLDAIRTALTPEKKRILFLTYISISESEMAEKTLYEIWETKKNNLNVALSDEDYITLAAALAIRLPEQSTNILATQRSRIKDNDRKDRFDFVLPSLSANDKVRDQFFSSLSKKKNRKNEVGVLEALGNLHHPLRLKKSEKYLPKTLELLEEIQKTGDIFFPFDWLSTTFGYYQSEKAERIVRDFLKGRPKYNTQLKAKILQSVDDLFRARRILHGKRI